MDSFNSMMIESQSDSFDEALYAICVYFDRMIYNQKFKELNSIIEVFPEMPKLDDTVLISCLVYTCRCKEKLPSRKKVYDTIKNISMLNTLKTRQVR